MKEYTSDELWELYDDMPEELQEAIFSEKTAEDIANICDKNEIKETAKLAKLVGYTLVGILPPEDLEYEIKKELNLSTEKAERVYQEVNRFIFFPLKNHLGDLYERDFGLTKEKEETASYTKPPKREKAPKASTGSDSYREPIE